MHASVTFKTTDIQSRHMAGQAIECLVLPKQNLRAVRHVFVSEWPGAYRVENGALTAPGRGLVFDPDRNAIAIMFHVPILTFFSQDIEGEYTGLFSKERCQPGSDLLLLQFHVELCSIRREHETVHLSSPASGLHLSVISARLRRC